MSGFAKKIARLLALLGLIAGLLAPAVPGFAAVAPAQPSAMHTALGCGEGAGDPRHQAPARHLPGAMDCCVANVCAMNLALPAHPTGIALSVLPETAGYNLRPLQQPAGINTAPIPHPPKPSA